MKRNWLKIALALALCACTVLALTACKCKHKKTESAIENEVAATCAAEGSYDEVEYCQKCGEELSRTTKYTEKLAHTPGEWTTVTEATCFAEGSKHKECSVCGAELETGSIDKIAHTPAAAVRENEVAATCTVNGSYDEVVYCSVSGCGHEISREAKTITAPGHTPGEPVIENSEAANCFEGGSYDEVVYCSVAGCGAELSRTPKTVPATGEHIPAAAVRENEVAATCTVDGSYDEVVYCSVLGCGAEISREAKTITASGHTPAAAVHENEVAATCTVDGSYDEVVYCSTSGCGAEISRTSKTITATGEHIPTAAVTENRVEATCYLAGSYDRVIYCSVPGCGYQISRTNRVIQKTPHTPASAVVENKIEATCTVDGSYDEVIYCSVAECGEEITRLGKTIVASHEYARGVCTKCGGLQPPSEGLVFTSNGAGTCYVSGIGTCTDTEIVIPTTSPAGERIIEIGANAFANKQSITGIVIPDGVAIIGGKAFYNCNSLTSITIPNSVTSIYFNAFYDCDGLKAVYITDIAAWCGISFVDEYANPLCYANNLYLLEGGEAKLITDLVIPEGVTSIGGYAFYACCGLTSVIIPNSATSVGRCAFYRCDGLTRVTIGSNATSIGNEAFRYCDGLRSITIPNSVTSIGDSAFSGCYKLAEVINKSSLSITAGSTDHGYVGYYALEVHNGESKIVDKDGYLFYTYDGVNYLLGYIGENKDLVLPESYNGENYVIHNYAFSDRHDITSVTIPGSVTSIGDSAFYWGTSLTGVYITDIAAWCGISFANTTANPLYCTNNLYLLEDGEAKLITDLVIPEGVTSIGNSVFYGCIGLTSVIIPDSVTSIGNGAFYGCTGLTSITIPNSVTSIGDSAFLGCTGLTSVTIPDSVTSIGSSLFYGCTALTSVSIGNGVSTISQGLLYGCTSLESLIIPFVGGSRKTASDTYQYPFGYIFGTTSYVGSVATIQTYHGKSTTDTTSTTYYIPASLKSVTVMGGDMLCGAFSSCTGLTSVTIGEGVTSIGEEAFYRCTGLTSVTIGAGVKSIGNGAFRYCTALTSVTIPNSVTSIGSSAFRNCAGLTSVTIGSGVESIGSSAFEYCTALTSVIIGTGVTSIGRDAFEYCTALEEIYFNAVAMNDLSYNNYVFPNAGKNGDGIKVVIGKNVTKVPAYLFNPYSDSSYAPKITSVEFEEGSVCESIGTCAFGNCVGLEAVYITDITAWCGISFVDKYANPLYYANSLYLIENGEARLIIDLVIPEGVTSIGDYAFYGCTGLTSVTIGNSVRSIGSSAFYNCYKLVEVINKSSLTITKGSWDNGSVGAYALEVHNGDSIIENIGGYSFFYTYDGVNYLLGYKGEDNELVLPESYNGESYEIYKYAFYNRDDITSVTIPNSVTRIGSYAFDYCTGLEAVYITDIAAWCDISFDNASANPLYYAHNLYLIEDGEAKLITDLVIPEGVTSIGNYAFLRCTSLTSATIPNSVTSIGFYAFSNCTNLTSVTFANPNGWWYASSADSTSGTSISATSLENASTAATYLKYTYSGYYWKK